MDIKDFYNPVEGREYCRAPFNFNGRTIATNGVSLLSMPLNEEYQAKPPHGQTLEVITKIMNDIDSAIFKPMPLLDMPDKVICSWCKGNKKASRVGCIECQGEGEVDAETDYNTYYSLECKSCDGDGYKIDTNSEDDCQHCNGTGSVFERPTPVLVDNINVDVTILSTIINSENLEISVQPDKYMLLFRSGDFNGAIMGMRV